MKVRRGGVLANDDNHTTTIIVINPHQMTATDLTFEREPSMLTFDVVLTILFCLWGGRITWQLLFHWQLRRLQVTRCHNCNNVFNIDNRPKQCAVSAGVVGGGVG